MPTREVRDLFGTGRMSEFLAWWSVPGQGWAQRVEISAHDDSRVDLTLEFIGIMHPLDGRLVKIFITDRDKCRAWSQDTLVVAGRKIPRTICTDTAAQTAISSSRALEFVQSLSIIPEREASVLGRVRPGQYEPPRG
jgi:hypothetical protein